MSDTIADMIIRIKNGYLARKGVVEVPFSKMKQSIAQILVSERYVEDVRVEEKDAHKNLLVTLRYVGKTPAVTDVKRISKPGRRVYSPATTLPKALGGYGITIVSTNKGIMTETEARKQKVGGEVLCKVW